MISPVQRLSTPQSRPKSNQSGPGSLNPNIGFNVNVTTVDPAVAAGQSATDTARQAYYDATPNTMHTIVGSQVRAGNVKWYSNSADRVSGLGVVAGVTGSSGDHTNWMFSEAQAGAGNGGVINGDYIGVISAHENGHAFGLYHQGDWTGSTKVNEYSNGDANPGNGSYVPIIGNASDRQRVTWRVGDTGGATDTRTPINDIQSMLVIDTIATATGLGRSGAADLHLINDGIGHTRLGATVLPLTSTNINSSLAQGVIVPLSESDPNPIGANNYTRDWFKFNSDGVHTISLTSYDGTSFLTPGVADGVGTLRSTLSIYDSSGAFVGSATEDSSTLFETYSGLLGAGTYYAEINSFGGHVQNSPSFNAASYYDTGAYFLSGSGFAALPEPSTFCLVAIAGIALLFGR